MDRLSRITAILIQLQSKQIVPAREMAERFEVSTRTIYRDIATLQNAGVPISFEQARGYFIVKGYSMPPISVMENEAHALITFEKLIRKQGDKSLTQNFESLLIKIKATLKSFQKEKIDKLEGRIGPSIKSRENESDSLLLIQKAIANTTVLSIKYHSISKEETTKREIDPLAVYFTENAWVVIAYCHLRKAIREFRLDRIVYISETDLEYVFQEAFSLENYFENYSNPS